MVTKRSKSLWQQILWEESQNTNAEGLRTLVLEQIIREI